MAKIEMTLEEYNELVAKRVAAENELADVKKQLTDARATSLAIETGGESAAKRLDKLVRDAVTVVRFAVANLPPETTPGWPVNALQSVAANLDALPTFSIDDRDLHSELRAFAREAESHEVRRASERLKNLR